MGNLFKYSGLVTKIRAMQGNMLTNKDYNNIVNMNTVKDITLYLKNCPAYSSVLLDIDENNTHRGEIEKKLIISMYKDYEKIYKFSNGSDRNFLNIYFINFEVEVIKILLRMLFDSRTLEYNMSDFEKFFMEHSRIDIKKISKSQNIYEFIENLKETEYYNIVSLLNTGDNISLFDIEMRLDIHYFFQLWKLKEKYLNKSNKIALTQGIGVSIDLLNIICIYRAKTYYKVDNDIIYSYILPIYYKIKKNQVKSIVEAKDYDSLINEIKSTPYAKITSSFEHGESEKFYNSIVQEIKYKANKRFPTSLAPVIYFMQAKELEISNITRIIESIRYNLEPNSVMKYINIYNRTGGGIT